MTHFGECFLLFDQNYMSYLILLNAVCNRSPITRRADGPIMLQAEST